MNIASNPHQTKLSINLGSRLSHIPAGSVYRVADVRPGSRIVPLARQFQPKHRESKPRRIPSRSWRELIMLDHE